MILFTQVVLYFEIVDRLVGQDDSTRTIRSKKTVLQ